jgi:hypothetical protein
MKRQLNLPEDAEMLQQGMRELIANLSVHKLFNLLREIWHFYIFSIF